MRDLPISVQSPQITTATNCFSKQSYAKAGDMFDKQWHNLKGNHVYQSMNYG